MEDLGVFRILSLVLVWGIPAVLVLAVVAFIILAPAFAFGGLARKVYENVVGGLRRKARQEPAPTVGQELSPTVGEILAAAGVTFDADVPEDKEAASKIFMRQPVSEVAKLLAKAGIKMEEEPVPKHCWEILHCPPLKREACPAYGFHDMPCWVAIGLGRNGGPREVCVNRVLLDLKTLTSQS